MITQVSSPGGYKVSTDGRNTASAGRTTLFAISFLVPRIGLQVFSLAELGRFENRDRNPVCNLLSSSNQRQVPFVERAHRGDKCNSVPACRHVRTCSRGIVRVKPFHDSSLDSVLAAIFSVQLNGFVREGARSAVPAFQWCVPGRGNCDF